MSSNCQVLFGDLATLLKVSVAGVETGSGCGVGGGATGVGATSGTAWVGSCSGVAGACGSKGGVKVSMFLV